MSDRILEDTAPVFICGTSRSGTNLMGSTLRDQTERHIVGETHYFDDLRARFSGRLDTSVTGDDQRTCEDYFLALTHRPYGHKGDPECASMRREVLRTAAESLGGTPDAYFIAYCQTLSEEAGKTCWGEKTPRHALRIDEILALFPTARVIYLLRDPRAVVASYRDWKNQGGFDLEADPGHAQILVDEEERTKKSYHPVIITLLWKAAFRAAKTAVEKHGTERVRIVRYESLCSDPKSEFEDVFEWIGSEATMDPGQVTIQNSSYEKFDETGGVSTEPSTRWKKKLSDREIGLIEFVCSAALLDAGYELVKPDISRLSLLRALASTTPAIMNAIRANSDRSGGNIFKYVARRARLALR